MSSFRPTPEFVRRFGEQLRAQRRLLRLRPRHLADARLPAATLKAAERGELLLDRPTITQLASRYGLDMAEVFPPRDALAVGTSAISIGDASEPCNVGELDSMLMAYLQLVNGLRGGDHESTRTLRRDDIRLLAQHLGMPCTAVISRLADLMDATGAEARAMIDLYLTGASVVGLHSVVPSAN